MSCSCDSTTTTVVGCCSIHGTVPSGIGFIGSLSNAGGAQAGAEIPIYTADGTVTPLTITSSVRLWVANIELVITSSGDSKVYRGTSTADDALLGRIMTGGPFPTNGGIVKSLPYVRTALGDKLYVKTAGADLYRVTVYGIYETV